jgi:hypothetical protein
MKNREFKKFCKFLLNKQGLFDIDKIKNITTEERKNCMNYIVKNRMPLLFEFIIEKDKEWLYSMGYNCVFQNKSGYKFLGTCEHKVKHSK